MKREKAAELFERQSKVLEAIARQFPRDSSEYLVVRQASLALFFSMTKYPEKFRESLDKSKQDLTDAEKLSLREMGLL